MVNLSALVTEYDDLVINMEEKTLQVLVTDVFTFSNDVFKRSGDQDLF